MSHIYWKTKGILKATLEYYCKVDNWPMSLAPMNGESGEMSVKTSQRKDKG